MAIALLLTVATWASSGFRPVDGPTGPIPLQAASETGDWLHFGNTQAGTHFSPLTQLTAANVNKLEMVWQRKLGPMPAVPISTLQTVPLKVGDHLYACTQFSDVMDLGFRNRQTTLVFRRREQGRGYFRLSLPRRRLLSGSRARPDSAPHGSSPRPGTRG